MNNLYRIRTMLIINTGQHGGNISVVKGTFSATAGTQFYTPTTYLPSPIDLYPTVWVHM